jgi:hypothetical protein
MIDLKNMTASSENNGIWWGVSQVRSVLVLSDVVIIFLNLIIVPTPNGNFRVVSPLHSGVLVHRPA